MIVVRNAITVKRGRTNEAIALLKEFNANSDVTVRIYRHKIGDSNAAATELEFEDLAHYERWQKDMAASPEMKNSWKPWLEMTTGVYNDVWELVELE